MTWGSHAANRGKDWCHLLRQYTFRKRCILGASTYRLVSWKMNKMWAAGVVLQPPMAPNADCSSFNLVKHWVCASALSSGSVEGLCTSRTSGWTTANRWCRPCTNVSSSTLAN